MRPALHPLILPLAVLSLLTACASGHPPEAKAPPATSTTSPNGEPLPFRAGADDCRGALAAWFNRADRNGDGVLDLGEMQADAERWFAIADRDHDGSITADELAEMRRQLVPEPAPEPAPAPEPGRGGPGHPTPLPRSQARLDVVMQADANVDFRVSATEFRTYVAAQFAERERGGIITQPQVLEACSKAAR